jgi:hypothetical protein
MFAWKYPSFETAAVDQTDARYGVHVLALFDWFRLLGGDAQSSVIDR